jgi:RNA polymerase sigma factor (sigma-70 family)
LPGAIGGGLIGAVTADPTTTRPGASGPTHRAIEAVFRLENARLIAGLAHLVRDVGLAEELAQEAMVAALEQWPRDGVPANPGAWLTAVGRRRGIDAIRRSRSHDAKLAQVGREMQIDGEGVDPDLDVWSGTRITDDLLRLIFLACHPALTVDTQVAMTLRLLGGLSTAEIARAYLVAEPTVAQRISRAKRTLRSAAVSFEAPGGDEVAERLPAVLRVIYLIFNEGYTATAGDQWTRPDLCHEALRLARLVQGLAPLESEAHALAALLELQASRLPARIGPDGRPVLLEQQNRARWDWLLIRRGLDALRRAEQLAGEATRPRAGRAVTWPRAGRAGGYYGLQAAIAACHARAATVADTDWARIAELYGILAERAPSPIVELNRAVAVSRAHGPQSGLNLLDAVAGDPMLRGNHLVPSVRGDLLARLGRRDEARAEFARAAGLARNAAERDLLLARSSDLG